VIKTPSTSPTWGSRRAQEHAAAPSLASPAAQCIATADAKRERRADEPEKVE
jgi:hypothetical protein